MYNYSIQPNRITRYYHSDNNFNNIKNQYQRAKSLETNDSEQNLSIKTNDSQQNLSIKRTSNELSNSAKKNLQKAVNWLVYLSESRNIKKDNKIIVRNFQCAFVTLHLPSKQRHTHGVIVSKSLNNFLTLLRKNHKVENYVWRAELQKNGNLHFHILIDKYVNHKKIRQYWNSSIELLGYVTAYEEKFAKMSLKQYLNYRNPTDFKKTKEFKKAYFRGQQKGWKSPNSTDIHSLRNVNNAAAYVSKYLTKSSREFESLEYQESLKMLTGRLWFCSQSISKLKKLILNETIEMKTKFLILSKDPRNFSLKGDFFHFLSFNFLESIDTFVEDLCTLLFEYARETGYSPPYLRIP